jgi:uncharacterized membrane protein YeaQ/YmgE (transglycosylase-associated protein family)
MGIVVGSAVAPIFFALTWKDCSATGALTGAVVGQVGAIIAWLVTAQVLDGEITLATTGGDYPMLAGNLVAIFLSAFVCIAISLTQRQNFDWALLKEIPVIEMDGSTAMPEEGEDSPAALNKAYSVTCWTGGILSLVLIILWPVLTLPAGVFSKSYFYFWIILSLIWGILASAVAIFLPLWETRDSLMKIAAGIVGAGKPKAAAPQEPTKVVEASQA